jgi:molybdopterin converting factor small subunit
MALEVSQGISVLELIHEIGKKSNPSLVVEIVSSEGRLRTDRMVIVNGRNIENLDNIDTKLTDEDTVSLFPTVGGG